MVTVATDAKRSRGALGLKKRLGPTSASDLALRSSQPGTPRSAERNVAKRHRNSLSVSCEQIKLLLFIFLLHLCKNSNSNSCPSCSSNESRPNSSSVYTMSTYHQRHRLNKSWDPLLIKGSTALLAFVNTSPLGKSKNLNSAFCAFTILLKR